MLDAGACRAACGRDLDEIRKLFHPYSRLAKVDDAAAAGRNCDPVQINGKIRDRITVPAGTDEG